MTDGEIVIAGLLLFLAFKDRLAAEWYRLRKRFFWRPVRWYQKRRRERRLTSE